MRNDNFASSDQLREALTNHAHKRSVLHKQERLLKMNKNIERYQTLDSVLTPNQSSAFTSIKHLKSGTQSKIQKLTVKDKIYCGDNVPDGFFDSLSSLKTHNSSLYLESPVFQELQYDYETIVKISSIGEKIPENIF